MINPYALASRFDCSDRVLIPGLDPLPVPPLPHFNYTAHDPRAEAAGVSGTRSALTSPERQELAQAMINWWRAWGGIR